MSVGGDKRDRTADLLNAIQALSQLSYTPIFGSLSDSFSIIAYMLDLSRGKFCFFELIWDSKDYAAYAARVSTASVPLGGNSYSGCAFGGLRVKVDYLAIVHAAAGILERKWTIALTNKRICRME